MKLKATIISIVSVLIVGLIAILLYCFWPAIKGTVDNSKYYTQEELQESYDKGFEDGCKTEVELTGQVKYYKDLVNEYYVQVNTLNDEINDLNNQIILLTKNNKDCMSAIENLTSINEELISTNGTLEEQVETLNNEISDLDNQILSLTQENEICNDTIYILNDYKTQLEEQVNSLNAIVEQNNKTISELNNRISNLENSVNEYEEIISDIENENFAIVKFKVNDLVYNLQLTVVNGNVVPPTNPLMENVLFDGWTIDGETVVDVSKYTITEDTTFVAKITKYYNVTFKCHQSVNDIYVVYDTQTVKGGTSATLPTDPVPEQYAYDKFNGWSIDGENAIDISTYVITEDTVFIALLSGKQPIIV